ncbi:MAG TPA: VOC family protein [Streptosporangiaceae bacterium]|jgi:catechol 2,3-dioxygenase-like lactoylglutathione lyase family enzyme
MTTQQQDGTQSPDRPRLEATSITIGAPAPRELAAFYAQLLGWRVTASDPARPGEPEEAGWAQVRPPEGMAGLTLNFEWEAHYVVPAWPSEAGKQHITQHLDIAVADLAESVDWAVSAGATLADFQPQEDVRVLFDPSGQPFCLFV